MQPNMHHTFHIPVMGLAFSVDSPLKVAQYGISSTLSLSDDTLLEQMREHYSQLNSKPYVPIATHEEDYRAKRVTAYLNMVDELVKQQIADIKGEEFEPESRLTKYFTILPDTSPLRALYQQMLVQEDSAQKQKLQQELRQAVVPGSIDVNIMTKLDKTNYAKNGEALPPEYSDALAALRGFANSNVHSSMVFSAGFNMRLYSYLEQFPVFVPDNEGNIAKKIIIKVSDYRSALVQGKILAKKGIWVSEFRVESGLNCGGHAFATDGYLLGPILEEFKQNREAMQMELYSIFCAALAGKGVHVPRSVPDMRVTVQGGIGTANEQEFLLQYYKVDATGWGTPFLLVPEATTVDQETLAKLLTATEKDLFLSSISPLGVPFNSLRGTSNEELKNYRIDRGKPGSPCVKKHLVSNSEFTTEPICTASRKYQRLKLEQLAKQGLPQDEYKAEEAKVLVKECLCEGLANTVLVKLGIGISQKQTSKGVTICPGPNLAYFTGIFKLQEMVDHIYGRFNVLNQTYRPHMFVNELKMYIDYWKNQKAEQLNTLTDKQHKYLQNFWQELMKGISYYKGIASKVYADNLEKQVLFIDELLEAEDQLLFSKLEKLTSA
ncbi:hypothetical protein ACFSKU_16710 [Pontibacter silvestris]|uniref:Uncharacterized protein n=1 Tax=Pontibacter silvestris TaxID=2305183 RepID=A0ABW4X1I8_9BACT|nr:hypothetical protein [Pontibacter silvestris]MCC9136115.1 hypothetical protein [Pontibacter silvestris]